MYRIVALCLCLSLSACSIPPGLGSKEAVPQALRLYDLHQSLVAGVVKVGGPGGHGSGVPIIRNAGMTWILTCAHVVDEGRDLYVRFVKGNQDVEVPAYLMAIDSRVDLALVVVQKSFPILPLMDEHEYRHEVEVGDMVWGAGFPSSVRPALITVGYVGDPFYLMDVQLGFGISHNASTWFGFSGGPVAHLKSGKVIGINARIDDMLSDRAWAVSVPTIRKFLSDVGAPL